MQSKIDNNLNQYQEIVFEKQPTIQEVPEEENADSRVTGKDSESKTTGKDSHSLKKGDTIDEFLN